MIIFIASRLARFFRGIGVGLVAVAGTCSLAHANTAPEGLSVSPNPHKSKPRVATTLTAKYRDAEGAGTISYASMLVNTSPTVSGGWQLYYNAVSNRLWVWDGTSYKGGLQPGNYAMLDVPQGRLFAEYTTVSKVGNELTVNWVILPAQSFNGNYNVYLSAADTAGGYVGNQDKGDWDLSNSPPTGVSVTPSSVTSPAGIPVQLDALYTDPDGASDLYLTHVMVNATSSFSGGFHAFKYGEYFYVYKDGEPVGGFRAGEHRLIEGDHGTLDCSKTTITPLPSGLRVTWSIIPAASLGGSKNIYLQAFDFQNATAGRVDRGDWTIPTSNVAPQAVSAEAITSAPGVANVVRTLYRDGNGATDIKFPYLLINANNTSTGAFYCYYNVNSGRLWVWNGSTFVGGHAPGSANVISVPQGSLNCETTTLNMQGTDLEIGWDITPATGFTGTKNLYLNVFDAGSSSPGFADRGDWTISSGNHAPINVSASPYLGASGVGALNPITARYRDGNGFEDIRYAYLLVNTTTSIGGGFQAYYNSSSNKLWVWNGSSYVGGYAPGSSNNITVPQGTLVCEETFVTGYGTDLTVTWGVKPTSSLVNNNKVFLKVFDGATLSDGFEELATWTISSSNLAPVLVSLNPEYLTSPANQAISQRAEYSDGNGLDNLRSVHIYNQYNKPGNSVGDLSGIYFVATNQLYMLADDRSLVGGFAPGSSNVISNTYGSLNCANTSVTRMGNSLVVNWNFTPSASFVGSRPVYLSAIDVNHGGRQATKGSWTVTPASSHKVEKDYTAPSSNRF